MFLQSLLCTSCFLVLLADCKPSFTKTPSSSNKVYVDEGAYYTELSWAYNIDGETVNWVDFMYKRSNGDDVLIARKFANQQLQVSQASGYKGRFSFTGKTSGNATFTIWFITKNDERTFEFVVHFTSVNNPWIRNSVELIVVGKLYAIDNLSKKSHIFWDNSRRCIKWDFPRQCLKTKLKATTTVYSKYT